MWGTRQARKGPVWPAAWNLGKAASHRNGRASASTAAWNSASAVWVACRVVKRHLGSRVEGLGVRALCSHGLGAEALPVGRQEKADGLEALDRGQAPPQPTRMSTRDESWVEGSLQMRGCQRLGSGCPADHIMVKPVNSIEHAAAMTVSWLAPSGRPRVHIRLSCSTVSPEWLAVM